MIGIGRGFEQRVQHPEVVELSFQKVLKFSQFFRFAGHCILKNAVLSTGCYPIMGQNMGQTVLRENVEFVSELFVPIKARKSPEIFRFQDFFLFSMKTRRSQSVPNQPLRQPITKRSKQIQDSLQGDCFRNFFCKIHLFGLRKLVPESFLFVSRQHTDTHQILFGTGAGHIDKLFGFCLLSDFFRRRIVNQAKIILSPKELIHHHNDRPDTGSLRLVHGDIRGTWKSIIDPYVQKCGTPQAYIRPGYIGIWQFGYSGCLPTARQQIGDSCPEQLQNGPFHGF